jgi:Zn-dependent protease with chaperone function
VQRPFSCFAAESKPLSDASRVRWRILIRSLIAPVLVFAFFLIAPHWYNSRVRSGILKDIEAKASPAEKAQLKEVFGQINFRKVCLSKDPEFARLRASLEHAGVSRNFRFLHWALMASVALMAVLLSALGLMLLLNSRAGRSPQALIRNYRLAWHLGMTAAFVQLLLLIPLLTYGAFMLTVLLVSAYSVKLLAVIAICGVLALVGSAAVLFKKLPLEFHEPMAREVSPDDAPELWQAVRQAAERLQTTPPDRVLVGMQLNFYVTELAVRHDNGVASGKTLYLSHPLLRQLSEEEIVSIIGHELGHFIGEDTRLTREFYPLRMKVHGTMVALARSGPVSWSSLHFLNFFTWCFGETEQAMSRQRELLADAKAAALTSPQVAARALVKFQIVAEALNLGFADALRTADQNPLELPLRPIIVNKLLPNAQFWSGLFEKRTPHPMDSHPALHVRLESLGQQINTADAQAMAAEESIPAYARWFSGRDVVFTDLTRQADAAVGRLRSATQVAEADYQTETGRQLLERHFPERKWSAKFSSLALVLSFSLLLILGCIAGIVAVDLLLVRSVCAAVAAWLALITFIAWKRHHKAEFTVNAEHIFYTGWNRPLPFRDIERLGGQKVYGTVTVTVRLKQQQRPFWRMTLLSYHRRTLNFTISSLQGKPEEIFETIVRYCTRQIKEDASSPAAVSSA